MRIGFDVSQTGQLKAGCGYFADTLIQYLAKSGDGDEYILYPTFGNGVWDPDWRKATRFIAGSNIRRGLAHGSFTELDAFWREPPLDLDEQLGLPDVVHANNFYCPTNLRMAKLVYTLYDLGFVAHPEWTTEANRITCFNGVFAASLFADRIIAISEYSREHFLKVFPHYPVDRISVVYPASRFTGPLNARRPVILEDVDARAYWLSVATLEPRKNHLRLLDAYARLDPKTKERLPLLLVGGSGWMMDDLSTHVESMGLSRHVRYLGYVDDATLAWLYENCLAFCYLSSFEGFGLPVVEAMSLGAPVIASNATSLPELVGDAGLLVEPTDSAQIAAAMTEVAMDQSLQQQLRQDSWRQASKFSWQRAAEQTRAVYRAAVASGDDESARLLR